MQNPIVSTRFGRLQGSIENNIDGGSYFAFKGIPYAKPPIGDLRFLDPVPPEPWIGVKDAQKHGSNCAQKNKLMQNVCGSEDCLYLNVYKNQINVESLLPVMVWIHGGAFMFGSGDSDMYSPDYLLKCGVIVVTINYRLGVLGFLDLEDETCPRNLGFKDQLLALSWVKENIHEFGGDSNNITIFGASAGGVSVHYLAISPQAKGLFHKAISQSGTLLNPWAIMPSNPANYAYRLCELLGNKTKDKKTILEFLRSVDIITLINAQENILTKEERHQALQPFGPTIEKKYGNPFLRHHSWIAEKTVVDIPYLVGFNDFDGGIFIAGKTAKDYEVINANFGGMLSPNVLAVLSRKRVLPKTIKKHYFDKEPVSSRNTHTYARMCSDIYFSRGIIESCKVQTTSSFPTFCYKFTFNGPSTLKKVYGMESLPGACHTDEVAYLFHVPLNATIGLEPFKPETNEYKLMRKMTEMWTNFAKTGNPTPHTSTLIPWHTIEFSTLHYLNINEELRMESLPVGFDIFDTFNQLTSKI